MSSVTSESSSSCRDALLDKLDTAKMHELDTSNVLRRDEPSGILALLMTKTLSVFATNFSAFLVTS